MAAFKSVVLVKQPLVAVWTTIRDRMPEIAAGLDDIESVTVIERDDSQDGTIRLVNEWRIKPVVPFPSEALLNVGALGWLDRAVWTDDDRICRWEIATLFLVDKIRCGGTTTYEPAMGGRGTRVTFAGTIDLQDARSIAGVLGRAAMTLVEPVITTMVPRNFRKTVEAAVRMLESEASAATR